MATATEQLDLQPIAGQMVKTQPTLMSLMQLAIERGQAEQLQILQEMKFKQEARDAEVEFNQAMNSCQSEIGRVAPDLQNPQTSSMYASYKALDKVLRPIYTKYGLSLSFSEEDCHKAEHIRVICYVSKGLHTRVYRKDMPVVTTGIKGAAMMTLTHATAAADSYGKRYLLKDIFNVAIGEDDTDGNAPTADREELNERLEAFANCQDFAELEEHWRHSRKWARDQKDQTAVDAIDFMKNTRKQQLREAGK